MKLKQIVGLMTDWLQCQIRSLVRFRHNPKSYLFIVCLFNFSYVYLEEADVNLDNVLAVLYAANKYSIQGLIDQCLTILHRAMEPSNVCMVLECAHLYCDTELQTKCFILIQQHAQEVLKSDTLPELCQECLTKVIQDDEISVKEEDVFQAVLSYAKAKLERLNKEATPANMKAVVGDVVKEIRFPLMTPQYFTNVVDSSGLLTAEDSLTLNRYFLRKSLDRGYNTNSGGFKTLPRRMVYVVNRFRGVDSGWTYKRDNADAISFKSSTNVVLVGVQVYGTCQKSGRLIVKLELVEHVRQHLVSGSRYAVRSRVHSDIECDGIQKIYTVYFDRPMLILRGHSYHIVSLFTGPATFHGKNGMGEVEVDEFKFEFIDSDRSTNTTTVETGQIAGLEFENLRSHFSNIYGVDFVDDDRGDDDDGADDPW